MAAVVTETFPDSDDIVWSVRVKMAASSYVPEVTKIVFLKPATDGDIVRLFCRHASCCRFYL